MASKKVEKPVPTGTMIASFICKLTSFQRAELIAKIHTIPGDRRSKTWCTLPVPSQKLGGETLFQAYTDSSCSNRI